MGSVLAKRVTKLTNVAERSSDLLPLTNRATNKFLGFEVKKKFNGLGAVLAVRTRRGSWRSTWVVDVETELPKKVNIVVGVVGFEPTKEKSNRFTVYRL